MYDKTIEGGRTDPTTLQAENDGPAGSLQRGHLQQEY